MKKFEAPELEIHAFDIEDVITVSGGIDEGEGGENDLPIIP